ncbi:MAG: hypothetical protein QME41_00890 [Actinomycetota bacterium]|nr:hypothetical protein [Actinomycetota bacterium]
MHTIQVRIVEQASIEPTGDVTDPKHCSKKMVRTGFLNAGGGQPSGVQEKLVRIA